MASSFSTEGLAEKSASRRWIVVAIFVAILAVSGFVAGQYPLTTTTEVKLLNNPESGKADELLTASGLRGPRPAFETIIIRSETASVSDPLFQQIVSLVTNTVKQKTDLVAGDSVFNYYQAVQFGSSAAEGLVSADRHTTIIPVQMKGNVDDAIENAPDYLKVIEDLSATVAKLSPNASFEIISVGDASVNHEINEITEKDAVRGERIGVPLALIVLVIVLGALLAAVLPIILAIVSIFISLGIISLVSQQFELSFIVFNMVTMIGLAVGIDYTLFVIDRYREERRRGHNERQAIISAAATAVRAVFFSGTTVVLALLGLFLVPNNIFRSLSLGAIVVVIIAVLSTMTLIPAILMLLGDKINWPRHRDYVAEAAAIAARDHETYHKGFWGRTTQLVMSHPWVSVIGSVAILLALSFPLLDMKSGLTGVSSLPEGTTARHGLMILQRDFAAGLVAPVEFVVHGQKDDPTVEAAIAQLYQTVDADPAFAASPAVNAESLPPQWSASGDTALIQVPLNVAPDSQAAFEAIDRIRGKISGPVEILVTGQSAINVDFFKMKDRFTPIVFVFVLGLSFVVLMMAFRSIVVPLKAIIMNLLSVGSAYGLIVLVFQKGYGDDLLGFQRVDAIEAWLPLFLFCVLFGLSMDYHVFLLSRIREHYSLTHQNAASVAVGLQATAKLITGAALIMVFVFSGFAAGRLVPLQQLGFGMAVSVALDATLIRMILVPASMELLGDRNWYFPSWLAWLPHLSIEGKPSAVPLAVAVAADD